MNVRFRYTRPAAVAEQIIDTCFDKRKSYRVIIKVADIHGLNKTLFHDNVSVKGLRKLAGTTEVFDTGIARPLAWTVAVFADDDRFTDPVIRTVPFGGEK